MLDEDLPFSGVCSPNSWADVANVEALCGAGTGARQAAAEAKSRYAKAARSEPQWQHVVWRAQALVDPVAQRADPQGAGLGAHRRVGRPYFLSGM